LICAQILDMMALFAYSGSRSRRAGSDYLARKTLLSY
jgi:hypothetical protein